jgi:hypothetical protein
MTIREYVEGRAMLVRIVGGIWIVGVMILIVIVFPDYGAHNTVLNLTGGMFLGTFVCLGIAALTKCPRCGATLRDMTYKAALPFTDEMPDCCPNCGVSINEPVDSTGNLQL